MNALAVNAHRELNKVIPQYVKRAKKDEYLIETERNIQDLAISIFSKIEPIREENVVLLENNSENLFDDIIAAMLYKYTKHPLIQIREVVKGLLQETKNEIIQTYIGERKTRRDRPGRALEFGYPLTLDLIGDFGIYRDLHRHRMLTQERQDLSTRLGFNIPDKIIEAGYDYKVKECRDRSADLYEKIVLELPKEAQYVVLFGFNIRWMIGMNFREAMHMLELRTIPQGHPNYRKMCQIMYRKIEERYPNLANLISFVDFNYHPWSREVSESAQRRKEQSLSR